MGSAKSTIKKHQKEVAEDLLLFVKCFAANTAKNDLAKANRVQAWMALDNNGNGVVSLAETGKWIQSSLISFLGDKNKGVEIYKQFYPSYIRAFKDAADCGTKRQIKGAKAGTTTDDYVEKSEFRILCVYLCLYACMFEAFSLIDGYDKNATDNEGVGHNDDRKISPDEWHKAHSEFKNSIFVALKMCSTSRSIAKAAFSEMDLDGKGAVILMEFCEWIKMKEIDMNTEFGKVLALDSQQKSQNSSSLRKKARDHQRQ